MAYPVIRPGVTKAYGSRDPGTVFGRWTETDPAKIEQYKKYLETNPRAAASGLTLEKLTSGYHPVGSVPWEKTDRYAPYDKELVGHVLNQDNTPETVRDFDPRALHANQPSLVSPHFLHYFEGKEGLASDKDQRGNAMPFVYIQKSTGIHRILAGHHRAAAALVKGEPLRARFAIGE